MVSYVCPVILLGTGIITFVGTSAATAVGMDQAYSISKEFSAFGAFAVLFVFALLGIGGGIIWLVKSMQTRLTVHRAANDKLTKMVFDMKDEEIADKQRKIEELLRGSVS